MKTSLAQNYGFIRSWMIYYGQPWRRPARIRFYRQFISPTDLCFDIGAHLGNRIDAFRACGARVVAVEPQPLCARYLQHRYAQDPNIILLQLGLDAAPGQRTLHLSSATPTVSSFATDWIQEVQKDRRFTPIKWDRQQCMPMLTLDNLIQEYGQPQFCKIDVEGFEEQVLQGLSHPIPMLSFEYIPIAKHRAQHCLTHLDALGAYRFNYCQRERMRFCNQEWLNLNQMHEVLEHMPLSAPSGDIYAQLYL
jgi:FkbM family methyltransferase